MSVLPALLNLSVVVSSRIMAWLGWPRQPRLGRLWWLYFSYPAFMAVLVQFAVLPYIFPQWHAGGGILIQGDSAFWHLEAIGLAQRIEEQGWQVWQLRPFNIPPIGIAAAIYALTIPALWTLIPLNAALHALASLVLFQIARAFLDDWRKAWLAVLPFWLYPTALNWYAQLHKDGFTIAGAYLFLYGWVLISQLRTWKILPWRCLSALGLVGLGAGLVWIMRPYVVQLMQVAALLIVLWLTFIILRWLHDQKLTLKRALLALALVWGMLLSITPMTRDPNKLIVPVLLRPPSSKIALPIERSPLEWLPRFYGNAVSSNVYRSNYYSSSMPQTTPQPPTPQPPSSRNSVKKGWQDSGWPAVVEKVAYAVAAHREYFISVGGLSQLDQDIQLYSVGDLLSYLPRAVQIAFFAPFPDMWFGQGVLPQTTLMRRLVAIEMAINYLCLAMLPISVWRWWRKPELWVVVLFSVGLMVILAMVVTNVGTLYRYRYGFTMVVVTLGLAGGLSLWDIEGRRRK